MAWFLSSHVPLNPRCGALLLAHSYECNVHMALQGRAPTFLNAIGMLLYTTLPASTSCTLKIQLPRVDGHTQILAGLSISPLPVFLRSGDFPADEHITTSFGNALEALTFQAPARKR